MHGEERKPENFEEFMKQIKQRAPLDDPTIKDAETEQRIDLSQKDWLTDAVTVLVQSCVIDIMKFLLPKFKEEVKREVLDRPLGDKNDLLMLVIQQQCGERPAEAQLEEFKSYVQEYIATLRVKTVLKYFQKHLAQKTTEAVKELLYEAVINLASPQVSYFEFINNKVPEEQTRTAIVEPSVSTGSLGFKFIVNQFKENMKKRLKIGEGKKVKKKDGALVENIDSLGFINDALELSHILKKLMKMADTANKECQFKKWKKDLLAVVRELYEEILEALEYDKDMILEGNPEEIAVEYLKKKKGSKYEVSTLLKKIQEIKGNLPKN